VRVEDPSVVISTLSVLVAVASHSGLRTALFVQFIVSSRAFISSTVLVSRVSFLFFLFLFFRTGGREASLKGGALLQLTRSPTAAFFRAQGEVDRP